MVKKYKKNKNNYIVNEEIEEYYHNSIFDLSIKKSNIKFAGKGVFTNEFIPANTFIDYYLGEKYYNVKCGSYFVEIDEEYGINAITFPRCYMAMINDAYNSNFTNNCEIRIINKNIEIWSILDIAEDEELFYNYGDIYWN